MRAMVCLVVLAAACGPAAATDNLYAKCSEKAKSNVDYNACGDALLKRHARCTRALISTL